MSLALIPNNTHPQGAAAMTQHLDRLGREVKLDHIVAFTWSRATGVTIGRVIRITPKKIRIEYRNTYVHMGETRIVTGRHITASGNTLILTGIEQHLTVAALKGLIA
jgi:hypothetical protein